MTRTTDHATLAVNGGEKALPAVTGQAKPKFGVEEFFSIAERFGFSGDAMERLQQAVSDDDLNGGLHFGRYYGSASPSMADRFEDLARDLFQVRHAYAVSNGTCALQAAMSAVGVGPGTEFIVPGAGFIATALAGSFLGATPVFCDVNESLQMDPDKLEALITPKTVAVIPTHHWGFVCDMDPIMVIAGKHGLKVIEDCAQSPGAGYKGKPVGSIGDIGCYSISSYKIIGGGEGGMVVTDDDRLFDRIRQSSEGGGLWRPDRFAAPRYDGELFVGSNYRLSELESSINVVQMKKLPNIVQRHRENWNRIKGQLGDFGEITWQKSNDPEGDIGYLMGFFPQDDELGRTIATALKAEGIGANYRSRTAAPDWHVCRYYYPILGEEDAHRLSERCPVAADLYDRCIRVPLSQWWSPEDCDAVAAGIQKVLSAYCTSTSS